jgi:hypothetical protein
VKSNFSPCPAAKIIHFSPVRFSMKQKPHDNLSGEWQAAFDRAPFFVKRIGLRDGAFRAARFAVELR